jgi:transcriptional regulator with XRE-family HTH domain
MPVPRLNTAALITRREAAQLSQAELARQTGISRAHMSMIESGARQCSLSLVMRFAGVLGCLVDDLLLTTAAAS